MATLSLLLALWVTVVGAYKPVILVHGVASYASNLQNLKRFILEAHPGTNVTVLSLYEGLDSLKNMWLQIDGFRKAVKAVMDESNDGVHLICFSQGGLVCRGIVQTMPNHNVHTFVSLASPQMGLYGTNVGGFFLGTVTDNLYRKFYTSLGQKISIGNYWNDPYHRDLYLTSNVFLPVLNNEISSPFNRGRKANFLRLKKLVAIGGPGDDVISPWQSSHFAFYKQSSSEVTETEDQEVYRNDSFGLKTLKERGDFIVYTIKGVKHLGWRSNREVFKCCIEKWLV